MRRVFWMAVGATAGVVVVRKVTRAAQRWSASGLAQQAGGLGESARSFADQVRLGMAEREAELRDALGLDGGHDLPPDQAAAVIEHPAGPRRTRRSTG